MSDTTVFHPTVSRFESLSAVALRNRVISPAVQAAVTRGLFGLSYMEITDQAHAQAFDALAGAMLSLSGLSQDEQNDLAPFIACRLKSIGTLGIEVGTSDLYVTTFTDTLLHPAAPTTH